MYGVRVLVSRSPSVVNLSLYRLCSARRARLGFDCAAAKPSAKVSEASGNVPDAGYIGQVR